MPNVFVHPSSFGLSNVSLQLTRASMSEALRLGV